MVRIISVKYADLQDRKRSPDSGILLDQNLESDSGPSVFEQRADSYSDSLAREIAENHNISVEEARKIVDAN
jgi:hypothetical protein